MRTSVDIDNNLLEEAMALGQFKTKSEAVNAALSEYVQRCKQARILELFGTVDYDRDYDYKAERRAR